MQDVEIEKNQLLDILKENRDNHKEVYEEAVQNYHEQLIDTLSRNHDTLLSYMTRDPDKGPYKVKIDLPVPEDHTADYDSAIRMLELEVRETITLDDFEFKRFVEDEWDWKRRWAQNTMSYTAG